MCHIYSVEQKFALKFLFWILHIHLRRTETLQAHISSIFSVLGFQQHHVESGSVSTVSLFLCCCNVLTIVCFKAKIRYFFFDAKQLPRIYLRGKLFGKMQNSAVSFGPSFVFEVRRKFMLLSLFCFNFHKA